MKVIAEYPNDFSLRRTPGGTDWMPFFHEVKLSDVKLPGDIIALANVVEAETRGGDRRALKNRFGLVEA